MKKLIFMTAIPIGIISSCLAGEPHWAMNVSAGTNLVGVTLREIDNIRAYRSTDKYLYDWDPKIATSVYLSFTPEYYITPKFSLSTGLRITNTLSKYESNYSYFYYKYKEDGCDTYYSRIKSIDQSNFYVGIPLEFRFTIRGTGRPSPYIRAGAVLNFRCSSSTKTNLYRNDIDYTPDTDNIIPTADNFAMPVYCAAGCQIGHQKSFGVEIQFPYTVAIGSMSSFGDTNNFGGGIQITYQFAKNKSEE